MAVASKKTRKYIYTKTEAENLAAVNRGSFCVSAFLVGIEVPSGQQLLPAVSRKSIQGSGSNDANDTSSRGQASQFSPRRQRGKKCVLESQPKKQISRRDRARKILCSNARVAVSDIINKDA